MIDPLENNLFDLPDYENTEDERFPPLPPPASPGAAGADWAEAGREPDGNQQSQTKDSSVATRKAVKRSIPKLDAHRLVSERGLPALRHMFDNVKFKGKGHEAEDLKTLIRHMEHWAHRLFPKLQFDDFIDKVESLGSKKEVQTCLKRIRLDLPILSEDFTSNEDGGGESNGLDTANEEVYPCSGNVELDTLPGTTLTEEQQQRIKRNRQLALERRQAKMQCNSQSQHNELSPSYPEEEEFNTPIAQGLADVTEDPQVAVTEAEDRDTELESASGKQRPFPSP